jgi:heme exporter protein C
MVWRLLLFVWIAAAMVLGFTWAPVVPYLEDTTRVIYFHVPAAWVTVLALGWSMVHSVLYLRRRDLRHDDQAAGAAELGVTFCILATVSGSLWAKAQWGSYWNWDPRETTIFFLLLVYAAYLTIRGAVEEPAKRARLSAVYSAVAFVSVPFLMFVVPRVYATLHPSPILPASGGEDAGGMDTRIRVVFWAMVAGFTALFFWVLSLRVRLGRLEREVAA